MMTREQLIWAISEMENDVDRKNIAAHDQAQRVVIARLEAEHKDLVLRNKLLRDRPDLPLERIQAYDEVITKVEQQAKENKTMREALQLLYDTQNGCPLPKYEADWNRAMELAARALREKVTGA